MLVDLISLVVIAFVQIWRSKDLKVFYVFSSLLLSNAVVSLAYGVSIVSVWYEVTRRIHPLILWSGNSKYALYVKAASFILIRYATLVLVNPRYTSTYIIVIIMLVFIGAVCIMNIIISPKNSRRKKRKRKAQIISRGSDGAAAVRNNLDDIRDFLTVQLPGWILCLMKADSLVISQFLLFLSCSMGELTRMMASLPSEQAAPAYEVLHKGSVVVVLLTGHTMAAEALGHNYAAVLAVTPELVAILVWLIFQLGYGGDFTARFFEDRWRRLLPAKTKTIALLSIAAAFLAAYISLMIELEATNLLWSYYYDLFVAWFYSVVLPVLFVLVLCLCWSTNKAMIPSEVQGAIQVLLCFALHVFVGGGLLVLFCYVLNW